MKDYSFIKGFQDIKITAICKKLNVNCSNVLSGSTSEENIRKVKNEIIKEFFNLITEGNEKEIATLYLYNEIITRQEKEIKMLKEMI